ncbi:hypothetical protein CHLNCDRAFT_138296 [Chlorella variabilis]|uniref:Fungal lipase-type domain-containing protein n=1 Tax=Chlorella variabilis TaxID=554065 RepID=E1ZMR0_CHLVA|nr:hypothetical protein CHLNCDRAFT_138296 [Chlorella variabilis]EFN52844.1 hypothetical protein CHLNCDRAFT_138296 [Chlorella variabilis]|eukprot:XP_005844946.1 hypothetical protein CHLNCDRAFT_138296 [Chlorella variabilis]
MSTPGAPSSEPEAAEAHSASASLPHVAPGDAGGASPPAAALPPKHAPCSREAASWASAQAPHTAYLRIEYFTNREARALGWAAYVAAAIVKTSVVVLVCYKFQSDEAEVLFVHKTWYIANTCVAIACLLQLLTLAAWFWINLRSTREARRNWNHRRQALSRYALILLIIQIVSAVFWGAPYIIAAAYRCAWFDSVMAWLSLVRWSAYSTVFLAMLIFAHECCRYHGPDPPDDPDQQLVMDVAARQKIRVHAPKLVLWGIAEALVLVGFVVRLRDRNEVVADRDACESQQYDCSQPAIVQFVEGLELVLVVVYALWYAFFIWRAFLDHAVLPFARYRTSNVYIRLMARHGIAAFVTVLFSVVMLTALHFQSCWSYLDGSLGLAPVQLALTLLVSVHVVTLMPKRGHTRDLLTTCMQRFSWTLEGMPAAISMREAERRRAQGGPAGLQRLLSGVRRHANAAVHVPTDVGRNLAELVRPSAQQQQKQQQEQQAEELSNGKHEQAHPPLEAVGKQEEQQQQEQEGRASGALPARPALQQRSPAPGLPHTDAQRQHSGVRGVLGEPRGQDGHSMLSRRSVLGDLASRLSSLLPHHVDPQLQQQQYTDPMFCLELAVRFFYWAKYAYRHWLGAAGLMDQGVGQRLFGFTDFEAFHDAATDTRVLLSWRDGQLLLAFRGTASAANAVTDMKAWQTPVVPRRYHAGRLVKAHAGFYHAYTANEDRHKLLSRIQEIVGGFGGGAGAAAGLRLYLTGHSLGGALAILAAYDLQRLFPAAYTTVYTFGSPRVGNAAFAAEYRCLVPDSWAVVNDQDPVTRIPTVGFRHSCQPVVVNARGDIIVRPSFFEREVLSRRSGALSHHQLLRYALSIAAVFSSSKWLPGGEAGAAALALAADLGTLLLLRNVDLTSLRDPTVLPESSEKPLVRRKATKGGRQAMHTLSGVPTRLLSLCSGATPSAELEVVDEEEEVPGEQVGKVPACHLDLELGSWEGEDGEDGEDGRRQSKYPPGARGLGQEAAAFAADAAAATGQVAAEYLTVAADVASGAADAVTDAATGGRPLVPLVGPDRWWRGWRRQQRRQEDLQGVEVARSGAPPPTTAAARAGAAVGDDAAPGAAAAGQASPGAVLEQPAAAAAEAAPDLGVAGGTSSADARVLP